MGALLYLNSLILPFCKMLLNFGLLLKWTFWKQYILQAIYAFYYGSDLNQILSYLERNSQNRSWSHSRGRRANEYIGINNVNMKRLFRQIISPNMLLDYQVSLLHKKSSEWWYPSDYLLALKTTELQFDISIHFDFLHQV